MLNNYGSSESSADFPYLFSRSLSPQPKYRSVCSDINALRIDPQPPFENLLGTSGSQTALEKNEATREKIFLLLNMCSWNDLRAVNLPAYLPVDWRTVAEQQAVIGLWNDFRIVDLPAYPPVDWRAVAEQQAVIEFGAVSEVALIYSDSFKAEQMFMVFVKGDQYNDALMDKLLDRELQLLDALQSRPIAVHYFPYTAETSPRSLIRESAKLIFQG
jgi:hypothetical protein